MCRSVVCGPSEMACHASSTRVPGEVTLVAAVTIEHLRSYSAGAIVTKCHRLGAQTPASHFHRLEAGGRDPGVPELLPPAPSPPCVLTSTSYKDASPTGSEPTLMTSFNLSHLCEISISKSSHFLRTGLWGEGKDFSAGWGGGVDTTPPMTPAVLLGQGSAPISLWDPLNYRAPTY